LKKFHKHHGRWEHARGADWDHGEHSPWRHEHEHFHRPPGWQRGRGLLFLRFAGVFGFMALLVLGGMAALAFVLSRHFGGGGRAAVLTWVGGCGLSLALPLLAAALARRAFQEIATPLADVMSAADAVAEGDLSVRVPARGPHEFGRLARSFNRMVGELERADQQRRNLTADVAHELRTPLHIIQGNLEGVLDGVYEPTADHIGATLEETRLLTRLVEDLRTLSLAEAGQLVLVQERVDVAELLADVGSGGTITLRGEPLDDSVHIIVRDTGEGIPAEDVPYVFDRFWRGDRSRSHAGGAGSGLGLAIARQLVQAHGGRIKVESAVGQGTTFTIEFPMDGK